MKADRSTFLVVSPPPTGLHLQESLVKDEGPLPPLPAFLFSHMTQAERCELGGTQSPPPSEIPTGASKPMSAPEQTIPGAREGPTAPLLSCLVARSVTEHPFWRKN